MKHPLRHKVPSRIFLACFLAPRTRLEIRKLLHPSKDLRKISRRHIIKVINNLKSAGYIVEDSERKLEANTEKFFEAIEGAELTERERQALHKLLKSNFLRSVLGIALEEKIPTFSGNVLLYLWFHTVQFVCICMFQARTLSLRNNVDLWRRIEDVKKRILEHPEELSAIRQEKFFHETNIDKIFSEFEKKVGSVEMFRKGLVEFTEIISNLDITSIDKLLRALELAEQKLY